MLKILTAPNRYVQGYGVIKDFGKHISHLGPKPFIIAGITALSAVRECVSKSVAEISMECEFVVFEGKGRRADAAGASCPGGSTRIFP
jgi:glycerol dehydrogenase-like iron-containing ADH family enzyme